MANIKLSDAPGCIGSPIIRDENHPICRNCPFKNVCAKLAVLNEKRLKEALGIETLSSNTGKMLTEGASRMTIAELEAPAFVGKKPLTNAGRQLQRSMFKKIGVSGVFVALENKRRDLVAHGLQSLKPEWSQELLLLIWDNKGVVKKKDLRDYMQHELGIAKMMAVSNVSNFINATTNSDLLKEDRETLRLNNEATD